MRDPNRAPGSVIYESLGDVWRHYVGVGFAMVGAEKPEKTPEQNAKDTRALRTMIRKDGYGFIPLIGHWIDTDTGVNYPEDSFFIPNEPIFGIKARPLRDLAIEWGKEFAQNSVVYYEPPAVIGSHKEHYKTHSAESINPKTGEIDLIPGIHFDRIGDIYSEIKHGTGSLRPFKLGVEKARGDIKAVIQIPESFFHAMGLKARGQIWNINLQEAGSSPVDEAVDEVVKES